MNRPYDVKKKHQPPVLAGARGRRRLAAACCGLLLLAFSIAAGCRGVRTAARAPQPPVQPTAVPLPVAPAPVPLPPQETFPPAQPPPPAPDAGAAPADGAVVSLVVKHGLPASVGTLLVEESRRYDLVPELVAAVIDLESGFDAELTHVNPNGSVDRGLMQLNDSTSPWLAARVGIKPYDVTVDPYQPEQNLRMGIWYLHWLNQRYHGDLELTLLGYNQGFGAADRRAAAREQAETAYTRAVARIATNLGYRGLRRPKPAPDATVGS